MADINMNDLNNIFQIIANTKAQIKIYRLRLIIFAAISTILFCIGSIKLSTDTHSDIDSISTVVGFRNNFYLGESAYGYHYALVWENNSNIYILKKKDAIPEIPLIQGAGHGTNTYFRVSNNLATGDFTDLITNNLETITNADPGVIPAIQESNYILPIIDLDKDIIQTTEEFKKDNNSRLFKGIGIFFKQQILYVVRFCGIIMYIITFAILIKFIQLIVNYKKLLKEEQGDNNNV